LGALSKIQFKTNSMAIFRIFFLLALPYCTFSQVDLYINQTIGQFDEATLTNVDISHYLRTELDVVYHATVLSENKKVLREVQSGIIRTHTFGRK